MQVSSPKTRPGRLEALDSVLGRTAQAGPRKPEWAAILALLSDLGGHDRPRPLGPAP